MRCLGTGVLAMVLVGCASVSFKPLDRSAQPKPSVGYVGGNFTLTAPTHAAAFVLANLDTGAQHTLAFSTQSEVLPGQNETVLIELPPGTYRATHWTVFNAKRGPDSQEFKKPIMSKRLTEPFKVAGGEVVFLGRFSAGGSWVRGAMDSTTYGELKGLELTEDEARRLLRTGYPQFGAQALVCIVCDPG